ncbi:YidC/Oxa1 family membrane protein insertase [Fimbriimonas ginsengisoli]|uniref:Inner membrane protein translocase component YidC n=1 Tax=Fimbriimonas ginsengisoli Gsoil 348 TaxID=661478 RepID=A0A068NTR6_FIMGI|nr:YidC/Oxa1 family membrane protein insertase [Fimbriimonas ginsengisoli]AIE86140.1 Inner membrane protein translocase component YidC [Fimbriimonas ginsengisoli Gsoil 348]
MSKPAPQKPNFLSTLLLMTAIFFAIQFFFKPQQQASPQPVGDLYELMHKQNAGRLDVSIASTRHQYDSQIDENLKAKKITQAEADAKKVESAVLVADTQYKAGVHANDTNRMRLAFSTLSTYERQFLDKPIWNTEFAVSDSTDGAKFGYDKISGQELYAKVRDTIANRNRTELVWGAVPGYKLIDALVGLTGRVPGFSYAFAAFLLALLVRSIVFPLSQKQIMYGRQMSQLTPLVTEIKAQYKDDQLTQNQKVMELYKEYGVNPMAGCAPALLQMPLFLMVYQCMLHYQFTFEKGTFLWINAETSKATHGFVAANLGQGDTILTLIYGVTMLISTLLTPISDPSQVKQQRLMGIGITAVWTFMMLTGAFPVVSAFVLYWTFTNILATAQSLRAYRLPLPPLVKVNTMAGGAIPKSGVGGKWAAWFEEAQRQANEQQREKQNGSPSSNGNGKPKDGNGVTFLGTGETKTGTPAKHKPKKRK